MQSLCLKCNTIKDIFTLNPGGTWNHHQLPIQINSEIHREKYISSFVLFFVFKRTLFLFQFLYLTVLFPKMNAKKLDKMKVITNFVSSLYNNHNSVLCQYFPSPANCWYYNSQTAIFPDILAVSRPMTRPMSRPMIRYVSLSPNETSNHQQRDNKTTHI